MQELFTIREVAEILKISVSSMYRYVETGLFPHTRLGVNIRFTNEHIAAFLAENSSMAKRQAALSQSSNSPVRFYDRFD
jgi:excisionase family DNA binding protein